MFSLALLKSTPTVISYKVLDIFLTSPICTVLYAAWIR